MQWYGLLTFLHLSPCHPFHFTASTSSTRQMRRPSPKHTHTCLASNASSRSTTASQGTQFPSTTPPQSRSPPPSRWSSCAHHAHLTHRRYPNPSLPAWACRQCAQCFIHASCRLARAARAARRSLLPSHHKAFRPMIWRCRRRAAGCPALRMPRDAFLTALAKAAFPPRVVAALDEPPKARQAPRSAVSSRGSRRASQAAVGTAEVEVPPGWTRGIWQACAHSSLLRCF